MARGMTWTPELIRRLEALAEDGLSVPRIASDLGLRPKQVQGKAQNLGLAFRPRRVAGKGRVCRVLLKPGVVAGLRPAAEARGISVVELAHHLLWLCVRDDLVSAILDTDAASAPHARGDGQQPHP